MVTEVFSDKTVRESNLIKDLQEAIDHIHSIGCKRTDLKERGLKLVVKFELAKDNKVDLQD